MNFADTNWLVSLYIKPRPDDAEGLDRERVVERFTRKHGGPLAISQFVLLEARNVFSRATSSTSPSEWLQLEADFGGRLYVDPMNWDLLRRECEALITRYGWKSHVGTFDMAIVASAKLAGARQFLSFDIRAKVLAAAEGLKVFPLLDADGKRLLTQLRRIP